MIVLGKPELPIYQVIFLASDNFLLQRNSGNS